MPNNNVAIISLMAKFDEKSIEDAAKKLGKTTEEALSNVGQDKFGQGIVDEFNAAMETIKKKLKGVNLSSYTNNVLDSLFSDKDIKEKTKDLQKFIDNISNLSKSLSGLNPNSFNSMNTKQLDAVISKQEKILAKEQEIAKKREQLEGAAKNVSKQKRTVNTISKNYLMSDFEKSSESLKKLFNTENGFDKAQEKSIDNLSKMLTLYSDMGKIEPKKGTTEAIKYSTDLLTVVKEIKETATKIDLFTGGKASKFISDNFDSVNKVSEYNVKLSQQEYVKNELKSLNAQKSKLEKSLTDYIADTVHKNLQKISNETELVIDKATQKTDKLQQKIDSLKGDTKSGKPIITNIVDETQLKSLEEIEDRLYEIYDKDSDGEATNQELKEFIQLYKQYSVLVSKDNTVKSDPELQTEYEYILKSSNSLQKYSNQLDEIIAKKKESSDINLLNSDKTNTTMQLSKQKEEIKETIEAEQGLSDIQKTNSNIAISVDAKQALEDISAVKEGLESIPNEKKISISVGNTDYSSIPLLSDEEGNVVTAFRGVTNAWSGLINQDGIGFFTDKLKLAADYADSLAESGKVFQANLSFHNPLEIEGNGAKWNEIDFDGVKHTTDEIIQIAKNLGYDGVIFKNIRDGFSDTEEDISNVMVALNAAQIKNEHVVGAVKAGTGELTKIESTANSMADAVVDSQNKIQNELQETQNQAEKTIQSISEIRSTPQELNISSASNSAIEQQNKLQEELKETQTEIVETRSKYQSLLDVAKKQLNDDKGTNYYSGKTTETKAFDNFTFNEQAKRSSHFDVWSKDYEELCSLMDKTEEELKSGSIGFDDAIDRMVSAYQKYDTATKIDVGGFDFLEEQNKFQSELQETASDYEKVAEAHKQLIQSAVNSIPQEENTARYVHWGNPEQSSAILSNPNGMNTGDYGLISSFADCIGEAETSMNAIVKDWDYLHTENFDKGSALIMDIPLDQVKEFEHGLKDNIPQEFIKGWVDTENGAITLNNTLQSELKETQDQAEKTAQSVKNVVSQTTKKDAFPDSSTNTKPETEGMEQVEKTTKEAVQAKKDFATANEDVQSSIDGSENPLKLEAELMEQIAKSAREAADAKKEFVEANKQVKDSAKKGNNDLANSRSGSAETSGNKNPQQKSNKDDNKLIQEQIKNLQKLSAEKQKAAESERKSTVNQASKDQLEAWKQIQKIRKEISNTSNSKIIEQLNQEKQTYQEQYLAATKILKNNSDLYNSEQRLNELKNISLNTTKQIESSQQNQLNGYDKKLSSYNSKVGNYDATINKFDNGGWTSSEYLEKVQKAKDILLEYEKEVNNLKNNPELVSKKSLANVENLGKEFENVTSEIKNMTASQKGYSLVSGQKELDKIRQILKENSAMSSDAKAKIKAYYKEIESGNPSMSLDKIHGEIMKIVNAEAEAGRAGKRMWDAIKEKAWYGVASTIGTYFGLNDVFRYIGQGVSTIRELDTALTEMKKVSNETEQSLKNYQATTFDTADAVGTTAKQIQNSTADWMRLGESMDQAAKSAKDATILLNVSEFEGIDEATDALVSMSQAYKDLDKMDIIDVLNNVGNNYSISTDGLATALKDSASALVTANNDLNEAVALTTAGKLITCIYRNIYNRMNLIAGNALEPCTTI